MSLASLAFFCIGLCVLQVTQTQNGLLPKPSLQAQPSSLVPLGQSVTLKCQGPSDVDLYRLEKLKSKKYEDEDFLIIPTMERNDAGRYRCSYQNGSHWSPASDQLELIATGVYSKPSLSAHPSSSVLPGRDVTLKCQSPHSFDEFVLFKEGDTRPSRRPEKWYRANFPIITVTAAHSGAYRCYSYYSSSPYLWSAPSDPLVLVVTGPSTTPSLVPTEVPYPTTEASRRPSTLPSNKISATDFAHQENAKGNLVRICLGAMIIIILVGLLAEDWHSRKKRLQHRIRAVQRPLPPLPLA
ncbi:platelet glycoprotein VI-like isoform X1 [Arvicanthis niloticus]|uniref:platelet glycoprotein VI isoform X1 n=1 Tax=Arvicanthis niloticus TaxID=61156 RepID=UPI00402B116A